MFFQSHSPDMIRHMHYETRMQELDKNLWGNSEAKNSEYYAASFWFEQLSTIKLIKNTWDQFSKTDLGKETIKRIKEPDPEKKSDALLRTKTHFELLVMFLPELEYKKFVECLFSVKNILSLLKQFNEVLNKNPNSDFRELVEMDLWVRIFPKNLQGSIKEAIQMEMPLPLFILLQAEVIREKLGRADFVKIPALQKLKEQIILELKILLDKSQARFKEKELQLTESETSPEHKEFIARKDSFNSIQRKTIPIVDAKSVPLSDKMIAEWVQNQKQYQEFLNNNWFIKKLIRRILIKPELAESGSVKKQNRSLHLMQPVNPRTGKAPTSFAAYPKRSKPSKLPNPKPKLVDPVPLSLLINARKSNFIMRMK